MQIDSIDYGFEYGVTFEYELGYAGDYNNAPEPHQVRIISILDYEADKMVDFYSEYKLVEEIEDYIHEHLNDY